VTSKIVDVLGLLLRIEVIKVAEEFIEALDRGKQLVAVTEVIFAMLERQIALALPHFARLLVEMRKVVAKRGAQRSESAPGKALRAIRLRSYRWRRRL
jgi:hypothetical protein